MNSNSTLDFPKKASEALKATYAIGVDLKKISKDFLESKIADFPDSFHFSDKSTRIYECESYFIDIYKWDKQVTTIHSHNFEGAFSLLAGHSTQVNFSEVVLEKKDEAIDFVKLKKESIIAIEPGDIHEINYYEKFIHNILHKPISLTICIRTFPVGNLKSYFYPSIGFSYLKSEDKFLEELQAIKDTREVEKLLMKRSLCTMLRFLRRSSLNTEVVLKCVKAKDPKFFKKLEKSLEEGRNFDEKIKLLKSAY